MATNLRALKIAAEKVELIQDTLNALDEATTLIAAFMDVNGQVLPELIKNIEGIKSVASSLYLLKVIAEDIKKGTYFGGRKLDVDLSLNKNGIDENTSPDEAIAIWNDTTNTVYYDKAVVTFVDGTNLEIQFVGESGQNITVSTNSAIVDQLNKNIEFANRVKNTVFLIDIGGKVGEVLRFSDVVGENSNIDTIKLYAVSGAYIRVETVYSWVNSTSSLEVVANKISDIVKLQNEFAKIESIVNNLDSIDSIIANLSNINSVANNLTNVDSVANQLENIQKIINEIIPNISTILDSENQANIATQKANVATQSSENATSSALEAKEAKDVVLQAKNEVEDMLTHIEGINDGIDSAITDAINSQISEFTNKINKNSTRLKMESFGLKIL